MTTILFEHLVYTNYFTCSISFNPSNPRRPALLLLPYCADETEAQKGEIICAGSHDKGDEPGLKGHLTPKPTGLTCIRACPQRPRPKAPVPQPPCPLSPQGLLFNPDEAAPPLPTAHHTSCN